MRHLKKFFFAIIIAQIPFFAFGQQYTGYTLVWSDEFDGGYTNTHTGTGLDTDSWAFETGNGDWGWGTGQRDYATTDIQNVEVSSGTLKIRTQRNHPNQSYEYTSGRINSKGKRFFTYGKIEAKIRTVNMTERGRGFAFWMMPNGLYNGTTSLMWPQGGEIDIFEYNGMYPRYNLGSVHHAWKWNNNLWGGDGNHAHSGSIYNPLDRTALYKNTGRGCGGPEMTQEKTNLLGTDWHTYGINWFDNRIEFYVDQDIYHVFYFYQESWCGNNEINNLGNHYNKAGFNFNKIEDDNGVPQSHASNWDPFRNPFYIILSAGVGGSSTYGGNITDGTNPQTWTCTTEIDWVRAYAEGEDIPNETNNIAENKIQVYVDDYELKIQNYKLTENDVVEIFDISGRVVESMHALHLMESLTINVSALPQGIYFIKIGNKTAKFIKK
jgi:beta-glucanase (GH16 family)